MSDRCTTHDDRAEGPGLGPLLVSGIVAGGVGAVCALALGAGWLLVLLTYWLVGTAGLLGAAVLASGVIRLRLPRRRAAPSYEFATVQRFRR